MLAWYFEKLVFKYFSWLSVGRFYVGVSYQILVLNHITPKGGNLPTIPMYPVCPSQTIKKANHLTPKGGKVQISLTFHVILVQCFEKPIHPFPPYHLTPKGGWLLTIPTFYLYPSQTIKRANSFPPILSHTKGRLGTNNSHVPCLSFTNH